MAVWGYHDSLRQIIDRADQMNVDAIGRKSSGSAARCGEGLHRKGTRLGLVRRMRDLGDQQSRQSSKNKLAGKSVK